MRYCFTKGGCNGLAHSLRVCCLQWVLANGSANALNDIITNQQLGQNNWPSLILVYLLVFPTLALYDKLSKLFAFEKMKAVIL